MKQATRYFRQVKRRLPVGGIHRKEFLANIKKSIEVYAAENPDTTLSNYYERFGTPNEIAVAFLSEMPYGEINSKMQRGRMAFAVAVCIAVVSVIALSVTISYVITHNVNSHYGYITDKIVIDE